MNRPHDRCEDAPCCGCCGPEPSQEDQREQWEADHDTDFDMEDSTLEGEEFDERMDGDHESALESVYGPSDPPDDIDTPFGDALGSGYGDFDD